jgi:hypothetical protein
MKSVEIYNNTLVGQERDICDVLLSILSICLKKCECKIWHGHPVWFIDGNPVVGYSKIKSGVRLMFWSGRDFDEPDLIAGKGRFRDASILYTDKATIYEKDLKRWLKKSILIQWDYKNIVKRKGMLERLV